MDFPLATILWLVFGAVFIIALVISAVLVYHWLTFGRYVRVRLTLAMLIYLAGGALILLAMFGALITYLSSINV